MCFSATASFTAAGILSVMGVLTIKAARTQELRLFASIPLFFALQQCLEGIIWLTMMKGYTGSTTQLIALYGFLFFAGIFWPVWVPALLYRLEEKASRKKIIKGFLWLGIGIALTYLPALILIGSDVEIIGHHLAYPIPTDHLKHGTSTYGIAIYYILLVLYMIDVVGSCFASSFPRMWIFGLFVGVSLLIAVVYFTLSLGSVWCFFAAAISGIIYFVVKKPAT